ncbi:MAG: S-methyl-5-thioribose-1-phosphate isomerase [Planctomycetaceae bacterium]|nr:S-methyl-5-thioribose-1-phosphate isomerase [Planctomycetaceae bacterium]
MANAPEQTLQWMGGPQGYLSLIDQTLLPTQLQNIDCHDVETVWEGIKLLRVRGAPAIGIAAAYGVCVGIQTLDFTNTSKGQLRQRIEEICSYLATSRPTAVNLFWALGRMGDKAAALLETEITVAQVAEMLLQEAKDIHNEDRAMCHAIGRHGAVLLADGMGVITHCNAGGLATSEYGTALSLFFTAQDQGKDVTIYVDETRPLLQGARLTAWELLRRNINTVLICDNMAAQVLREGKAQAVVTGADRIAANGDAANKIGTYGLAILAKHHGIPFYIAAPSNTFDLSLDSGDEIPIEVRSADEITNGFGRQTGPDGVETYNPAFDVTPAELIAAIVTEKGIISPVNKDNCLKVLQS